MKIKKIRRNASPEGAVPREIATGVEMKNTGEETAEVETAEVETAEVETAEEETAEEKTAEEETAEEETAEEETAEADTAEMDTTKQETGNLTDTFLKAVFEVMSVWLLLMHAPGEMVELRTIPQKGRPGYRAAVKNDVASHQAVFRQIEHLGLEKLPWYMVLNEIDKNSTILCNLNKVQENRACAKDSDIIRYRWVYVDIDPEHPAGTQATDEEMQSAVQLADEVKVYLAEKGFPEPVRAFTGNGQALYYRTNLAATSDTKAKISAFLKALASRFNTENATIDVSVCNPAHITKLIGCPSCKGENTVERPHRRTEILSHPDPIGEVSVELLERVINILKPCKPEKKPKPWCCLRQLQASATSPTIASSGPCTFDSTPRNASSWPFP